MYRSRIGVCSDRDLLLGLQKVFRDATTSIIEIPLMRSGCRLPSAERIDVAVVGAAEHSADQILDQIRALRTHAAHLPVIVIAHHSSEDLAVEALRLGVNEYLRAPVHMDDMVAAIGRLRPSAGDDAFVGSSQSMENTREYIRKVASADTSVLITGETGTGKELAAQTIHRLSARSGGPLVSVNCAAIPDTLLESELFGHERGAFTGAVGSRAGAIEAADRGTILLDEVGELSPFAQAKFLRVLDTRQVQKLGSVKTSAVNVRVLAATNRNLETLVAENQFRRDLFYRLNVARVRLSALRDRKEDLPALCSHGILELNRRFGLQVKGLTDEALSALCRHHWPGNVRELKNLLEVIFVSGPREWITQFDFPEDFRRQIGDWQAKGEEEKDRILCALLDTRWNCKQAAAKLKWSRMTLYRKMAKHRLSRKG